MAPTNTTTDTCWTFLVGNGTLGPLVIETTRKDIPESIRWFDDLVVIVRDKNEPRKGSGRRSTLQYFKIQIEKLRTLSRGDLCTRFFTFRPPNAMQYS